MGAPDDDPWRLLADIALYAPAGALLELRRQYPELIAVGRRHVDPQLQLARFVGEFAVRTARRRAVAWWHAQQPAPPPTATLPVECGAVECGAVESGAVDAAAESELVSFTDGEELTPGRLAALAEPLRAGPDGNEAPQVPSARVSLPERYDELSAADIVAGLPTMPCPQRDLIEAYERSHRARRTILHRLAQLRALA